MGCRESSQFLGLVFHFGNDHNCPCSMITSSVFLWRKLWISPTCDFVIPRCEKITLPRCGSRGFGLSNMPRCVAPQRTRCLHLSEISEAGHVHTISGNWKFQHGHVRTDISTTFSRLVNPKSTGKRGAVLRRTSGSCDLGQANCLAEFQLCHVSVVDWRSGGEGTA